MRLFVALKVPEPVRAEVGRRLDRVKPALPAARFVPADLLHLTLVFLGETDPALRPALEQSLAASFARHAPLALQLAGGGTFPAGKPARVAWVGVECDGGLGALQEAVAAATAEAIGRRVEKRPFHPHLTLARCRRPWLRRPAAAWAEAFGGAVGEAFRAEAGVLFESRLSSNGAIHEALATFPLAGGTGR